MNIVGISVKKLSYQGFALMEVFLTLLILCLVFAGFIHLIYHKEHYLNQNFTEQILNDPQSKIIFNYFKLFVNYPSAKDESYAKIYNNPVPFFPPNTKIIRGSHRDLNGSDTIQVNYYGNDNYDVFSCLGTPLKATQSTESFFYIQNGKLACSIVENGTPNMNSENVLIEDVEVMHIRYGEDIDQDGIVNRYVPADFPDLSYDRVTSVKISVLTRTGETMNPLISTKYYQLDDVEVGPFSDHIVRRVLTFSLPVNSASR